MGGSRRVRDPPDARAVPDENTLIEEPDVGRLPEPKLVITRYWLESLQAVQDEHAASDVNVKRTSVRTILRRVIARCP